MTEAELLRTAATLGDDAVRGLDEQRIARAVLERLAAAPTMPVHRIGPATRWFIGIAAAAAAMLLLVRFPAQQPVRESDIPVSVLHELDDLTVSELQLLLESLPPAAAATSHPEPTLDELDTRSLERLLRSLEG